MSRHAEMNGGPPEAAPPQKNRPPQPTTGNPDRTPRLDLIACDSCGSSFMTLDGPGMIAAIKGPCPDCGGRFKLASPST